MKKLILFLSLIAFVGLSAFDAPAPTEKVKTEAATVDNAVIAYADQIIMDNGAVIWQAFSKVRVETNLNYSYDQEVCSTNPNGDGLIWCCVFSSGGHGGNCYQRCPYCPSPW